MAKEYLDKTGLAHFWEKIKGILATKEYVDQAIEDAAQASGSVTGVKGNAESSYRAGNVNITPENLGLGNVENKSSAVIRGELTSGNVTDALGFTPTSEVLAGIYRIPYAADNFNYNFKYISTTDPNAKVNATAKWNWTSATKSNFGGIPDVLANVDTAVGIREVIWTSSSNIMVVVTEEYPEPGRKHYCFYNSGSWGSWYHTTSTRYHKRDYIPLISSGFTVAANGTYTLNNISDYFMYEICYYGWNGDRQSVTLPTIGNVNVPLIISAANIGTLKIQKSGTTVTFTNSTSQAATISTFYGITRN